jgi:hypothetical protein
VYKATHSETGITYALKKIKMDNEKDGVLLTDTPNFSLVPNHSPEGDQDLEDAEPSEHTQTREYLLF